MAGDRWNVPVKRFRPGEPIADTELRFLKPGDIFWYQKYGKPAPLPDAANRFTKVKGFYLVAASGPIWAREKTGKKKFAGIKFRAATEIEIRLIAYAATEI